MFEPMVLLVIKILRYTCGEAVIMTVSSIIIGFSIVITFLEKFVI